MFTNRVSIQKTALQNYSLRVAIIKNQSSVITRINILSVIYARKNTRVNKSVESVYVFKQKYRELQKELLPPVKFRRYEVLGKGIKKVIP